MSIVFVIDTQPAMGMRCVDGTSLLDAAKRAVELIVGRLPPAPEGRGARDDALMLVTTAPAAATGALSLVFSGSSRPELLEAVRLLRPTGGGDAAATVSAVLDMLNANKPRGENFGYGLRPWQAHPAIVVLLTCGPLPGESPAFGLSPPRTADSRVTALCTSVHRWDTRVFALVLRLPGIVLGGASSGGAAQLPLEQLVAVCEATGGGAACVRDVRGLVEAAEGVAAAEGSPGLVVNFKYRGHGGSVRALISTRLCSFLWPIPEAYFPMKFWDNIPAREPSPTFIVDPAGMPQAEVAAVNFALGDLRFPADVYDVRRCALIDALVASVPADASGDDARLTSAHWPVYVSGSARTEVLAKYPEGRPCGFLTVVEALPASVLGSAAAQRDLPGATERRAVLVLLPYDFPRLFALLRAGVESMHGPPTVAGLGGHVSARWLNDFTGYIEGIPAYYVVSLRNALTAAQLGEVLEKDHFGDTPLGWRRDVREYLRSINNQRGVSAVVGLAAATSSVGGSSAWGGAGGSASVSSGTLSAGSAPRGPPGAGAPSDFFAQLEALRRQVYPKQPLPGVPPPGGRASTPHRLVLAAPRRLQHSVSAPAPSGTGGSLRRAASLTDYEVDARPVVRRGLAPADEATAAADAVHAVKSAVMGDYLTVVAKRSVLRDPLWEPHVLAKKRKRSDSYEKSAGVVDEAEDALVAAAAARPGQKRARTVPSAAAQGQDGDSAMGVEATAAEAVSATTTLAVRHHVNLDRVRRLHVTNMDAWMGVMGGIRDRADAQTIRRLFSGIRASATELGAYATLAARAAADAGCTELAVVLSELQSGPRHGYVGLRAKLSTLQAAAQRHDATRRRLFQSGLPGEQFTFSRELK